MKITFSLLLILQLFSEILSAQPYVEGGNTRHRCAQLNLGASYRFLSNKNTRNYDLNKEKLSPIELNSQNELGLIIGGTHFWGHADFYILFPVAS